MEHFFIPELVELICEELGHPHVYLKDLAALARTATVFHDAALDVLWRHQGSPVNVILCMPTDLWESERLAKRQNHFALRRPGPITPSDLERPLIYSRRVKSLSLKWIADLFRILEVMKPFLPQGILFPNLRKINLLLRHVGDGTIFPYLSLDLVTSIHLKFDGLLSSLPDLPLVYPALKRLVISTSSPAQAVHLLTSTSIRVRKLIQIQELTLPMLDRAVYNHLSTLPALRSISVTQQGTTPDLLPSLPFPLARRSGFPVLRRLSTESMTLAFVTEVVNGLSNTPLRYLKVITNLPDLEHAIQQLFAALSTHVMNSALEEISLRLGVKREVGPNFYGPTLSHLLCFSNLREVTIYVRGVFLLDDAAVWDMARAWPNLVQLRLSDSRNVSSPPPIMTLASLQAFAIHCPELISLALTLNATVVPPSSDEQPVLQKNLLALDVWHSPIWSPALVGRFLAGMFPNIEQIQSLDRSRLWKEVEDVVKRGGI
ncbi:hypothetical protein B0H13DRAFT_1853161 [Mycena leptocephala]|nr:hypothetical protein B0H13DRAFT_1853161 [Mycena leptocephala]